MKKLSVLFSIFAVLMAVTFTSCTPPMAVTSTSCEDPAKTMEPFTKDMIGEWMIGTWDISSSSKGTVVQGEEEQTTESTTTGTYEIKGIEDDSEVVMTVVINGVEQEPMVVTFENFKNSLFPEETEGVTMNVSSNINKAKTKIEMNISMQSESVEASGQGKRIIDSAKRKADIFRFLNRVSVCCLL